MVFNWTDHLLLTGEKKKLFVILIMAGLFKAGLR